jgi:mRNA-degrading endonuclease RelE of RelBE toxin-antitoxin system
MKAYLLLYSKTSRRQVAKLHPEIKSVVRSRLDNLRKEPFAGKRLERELSGYRSLRARRFRIIYKVDDENDSLEIHYVGHRKDIYELFAERTGKPLAFG